MKEEWQKAFDLYSTALEAHDEDETPDITLFNRVGDIQTRLGQINGAVEQYEKAIQLYLEAELPNNAIAICKKVLRNLPDRNIFFLRMGQIRAHQGFLTDARQNFLTYAERQTNLGDHESALNALIEFVDISPEDLEIRQALALQLEAHDRGEEAVEQLLEVHRLMVVAGDEAGAEEVKTKLEELSPGVEVPDSETILQQVALRESGAVQELVLESTSLSGIELPAWGDEGSEEEASADVEVVDEDVGDAVEEPGLIDLDVSEEVPEEASVLSPEDGGDVPPLFSDEAPLFSDPSIPADDDPKKAFAEEDAEEEPADTGVSEEFPAFDHEGAEDVEILTSFSSDGLDALAAGLEEDEEEDEEEAGVDMDSVDLEIGDEDEEEDERASYVVHQDSLPLIGFEDEEGDEGVLEESDEEALSELGFQVADTPGFDDDESLPLLGFDDDEDEGEAEDDPDLGADMELALEDALEDASFEDESFEAAPEEEAEEFSGADQGLQTEDMVASAVPGSHEEAAQAGDLDLAIQRVKAVIERTPDDVQLHQRLVEYAFRKNDEDVLISAYLRLAGCLARTDAPLKAKAVYQQILTLSPGHEAALSGIQGLDTVSGESPSEVASSEEYVDLGSMILGDDAEESTRWTVAAEAPSGDEEADFAKMLSQFKDKVSEHVAVDDVTAHHDLGTAYMEMGLYDEAIAEFQMALRASPKHLPTHEVMGRCWMDMGKPDMAIRALDRALKVDFEVEDELIGIYYLMGRAQEDQGNTSEALEFYEKVFSLDINFQDVTERLRALR